MTSRLKQHDDAFVWIWLPGETEPVVAGRLTKNGDRFAFNYGSSYLNRTSAIPIYEPELPLERGLIEPAPGLSMARSIRDGSPDAWGRRVIINRLVGTKAAEAEAVILTSSPTCWNRDRTGSARSIFSTPPRSMPRASRRRRLMRSCSKRPNGSKKASRSHPRSTRL